MLNQVRAIVKDPSKIREKAIFLGIARVVIETSSGEQLVMQSLMCKTALPAGKDILGNADLGHLFAMNVERKAIMPETVQIGRVDKALPNNIRHAHKLIPFKPEWKSHQ